MNRTPFHFGIYFRAARQETASYPDDLKKTIGIERGNGADHTGRVVGFGEAG